MNNEEKLPETTEVPEEELPETAETPEEEQVVSVWYGSNNQKFFRRRYFDGYTYYETLRPNGKTQMHSVYTGYWHTPRLSKEERRRNRILYVLLWLFGTVLLFIGCTRYIGINSKAYGATPAFAALFAYGWMMVAIFNEFTVPLRRTIGDYRASSLSLQRSGLMASICCCATFVLTVVFLFIDNNKIGLHLLAAGCELASAVLAFLVRHIESKVVFDKELSEYAGKYTM